MATRVLEPQIYVRQKWEWENPILLSPLYDLANSLSEGFFHNVFFFVASHISSATSLMEPGVCLSVGKTEWVLTQILLFWQLSLLSSTTRAGWILIILSQQILHILKRLLRCFCICSFRCICFLYFGAFISPRRQKQIMRWALYQTLKKIHLKCIPVVCNNQISFLKLEKPLWRQLKDSFCQASHVLKLRSQIHQK